MQLTLYILGNFWEINVQEMEDSYRVWSAEPELQFYAEASDWRLALARFIVDNFIK